SKLPEDEKNIANDNNDIVVTDIEEDKENKEGQVTGEVKEEKPEVQNIQSQPINVTETVGDKSKSILDEISKYFKPTQANTEQLSSLDMKSTIAEQDENAPAQEGGDIDITE